MTDIRTDVQEWLGHAREAIDSGVDIQGWLDSVKRAIESGADPKRTETLRQVLEAQPDIQRWLDSARKALEARVEGARTDLARLDPHRPAPLWSRPAGITALGLGMLGLGTVLGVIAAYFFDPVRGRGRRTRARDRIQAWFRRLRRRREDLIEDGADGTQGLVHEAGSAAEETQGTAAGIEERVAIPVGGDEQRSAPVILTEATSQASA
jgi:hypothetical protein